MPTIVSEQLGFAAAAGQARRMRHGHRHHEIELNYVEAGAMTYQFGGGPVHVPAGQLAVFWASLPHQLTDVAPDTWVYWFTVPLAWALQWKLSEGFLQAILHGAFVLDPAPERGISDEILCRQWVEDLRSGVAERREIAVLELEARLKRLALAAVTLRHTRPLPHPPPAGAHAPEKVEQMMRIMAERYREDLSIADVAAAVDLHPNYAMTLFSRSTGMSMLEYLTQHRIAHAQRLLITGEGKMLEVALESGFGSLSQFYAAFRKACGSTPRKYRKALER